MDIIYSLVPLFQVVNEKKHFKWFQNGLTIVFTFNLLKHLFSTLAYIANFGIIGSIQLLYRERAAKIVKLCFILLRKIVPSADKLIQTQINDSIKMIQKGVLPGDHHQIVYEKLPICGLSESKVRTEIARYKTMDDTIWQEGKVSGTVYTNNEELIGVVSEAFSVFALSNPLHPQLFQRFDSHSFIILIE